MHEEYREIEGFPGYEVSDHGNVRNMTTGRVLKPVKDSIGYEKVNLCNNFKKASSMRIHRLVALSFLIKPEGKEYVDHINNNKTDNRLENIRWCSNKENMQNQKIRKNNTSSAKGVSYNTRKNRWETYIQANGKKTRIGYFKNLDDAIIARKAKANELFGEFTHNCEKI